jgi:hypothetical protein
MTTFELHVPYLKRGCDAMALDTPLLDDLPLDRPPWLSDLVSLFEESADILDLGDDWDGEGSPAFSEDTWRRAEAFLLGGALRAWDQSGVTTPTPALLPGPEGSISFCWQLPERYLLVTIPAQLQAPIRFYGDNGAGASSIRGDIQGSADNAWLFVWLVRSVR